ncbi:uncharacterized protein N7473_011544 [Penicillium subrubescens]|uniref:Uncharacterized protein n=1 Tax=Penicillium subrubescens TaxID=1316194 RepID=A0A1Q5UD89_9EURO|nr:uncharacterized protein N7473_011544 [Penicillium subrubescens]KAJ5880491.1 hypothetical protein N7473_011544 [Penicillium subrubescens]OKP10445.1 hypothetical protein PENSUB_4127 [Penicillium subrubescens]
MTKSKDQAASFVSVMDFSEHDNSEILRAVLLRTKGDYQRALCIFDKLLPLKNALSSRGQLRMPLIASVRFLSLHPRNSDEQQ